MCLNYRKIIGKYKYKFFKLRNVVGVGYGLKEKNGEKTEKKAIIVLVKEKMKKNKLSTYDMVPEKVEGYNTDVIEIGDVQFLNLRTERVRPVKPGVSIGHYKISAGTLGAVVRDNKSGKPLLLSNNHVMANISNGKDGRAELGDPILQPGVYDNGSQPEDVIGRLERFVPINGSGSTECPVAKSMEYLCNMLLSLFKPDYNIKFFKRGIENLVDCAVARPTREEKVDAEIMEIGKINDVTAPQVNMLIKKSGRTTGVTEGRIRVLDASVEVNMSENETAVFTNQFITDPISKAGDSGSLVVDENNKAVGLLFAGSSRATVCNYIENVLEELKVRF